MSGMNKAIGIILVIIGLQYIYEQHRLHRLNYLNGSYNALFILIGLYLFIDRNQKKNQTNNAQFLNQQVQNPAPSEQEIEQNKAQLQLIEITDPLKFQNILTKLMITQEKYKNKSIKIIKIINPNLKKKFKDYQIQLSKTVKTSKNAGIANTVFAFHGTAKTCNKLSNTCNDKLNCSVCSIINIGYQLKFSGKGASTSLRYGKGLYFSPEIEKAENYSSKVILDNHIQSSNILLANKVVLGNSFYPQDADNFLDQYDPVKYNSIYGAPTISNELSNSEICIFNQAAALPKYLLVFTENKV